MRKTFVVGKLAGSTARILLLQAVSSSTTPLAALDASHEEPVAPRLPDARTIH
jgi:hypothetical protein